VVGPPDKQANNRDGFVARDGASRQMLKQHVHAAMRRIAADGHLGDFVPLAFAGEVHGVHDVRWPGAPALVTPTRG